MQPPSASGEIAVAALPTNQRKRQWHALASGKVGTIVGIPSFSGQLVATDGILCQIMTASGRVVEGHLEFFQEAASSEGTRAGAYASTKTTTKRKAPKALAAYC